MNHFSRFVNVFLLLALSGLTQADEATTQTSINIDQLTDQHGTAFTFQTTMKLVMFINGMEAKDLLKKALEKTNTDCLTSGHAVYLANISGMPKLVAKLFAIPRMREYPYPIWLDRDGKASMNLPAEKDAVTLLAVENMTITGTEYFSDEASLTQRLIAECGAHTTN